MLRDCVAMCATGNDVACGMECFTGRDQSECRRMMVVYFVGLGCLFLCC
jgi:hypothetical protein